MSKSKNKFTKDWASATDLGRLFGLSAIAINKKLAEAGWRDSTLKAPTPRALQEGWARATPLADGTPHFMWSRQKVKSLISKKQPALPSVEVSFESFLRDVLRLEKQADELGIDKLIRFYLEEEAPAFSNTPAINVSAVCSRLGIASREEEILQMLKNYSK